jgi:hypothetical protein
MKELLENAKEELKRIDHLVYVTLKYTRTVDVFISVIERMINAYEYVVEALLKNIEDNVDEQPDNPLMKAEIVRKHYDRKKIQDNIKKYLVLRKLRRVEYEKSNEFRRHVTMSAVVDDQPIEINIDNITEDFHNLKDFLEYIHKVIDDD